MQENLLSIRQVSKMLGVSIDTLRRWDKSGKLKSFREKSRGMRHYREEDLEQYFKKADLYKFAFKWASTRRSFEPPQFFYCPNSYIFQARLAKLEALLARDNTTSLPYSLLVAIAGEIGNNSFDHNLGNWQDIAGVFFGFDLEKKIIVLADRGRGVLTTLKRVKPDLKNDEGALMVAFTEVISGRAPESRGNGLKFVRKIIAKNDLELRFQSGSAELRMKRGNQDLKIDKATRPVSGCIAIINYS